MISMDSPFFLLKEPPLQPRPMARMTLTVMLASSSQPPNCLSFSGINIRA